MGAHHHHDHGPAGHGEARNARRLAIAFVLIVTFMVVEVVGGVISGSLALLADAAHMATDALALGIALIAALIARRPADAVHSYGHERVPVLAAFANGLLLIGLAGWIIFEGVQRLLTPQPVMGAVMLSIAVAGLLINIVVFLMLHGRDGGGDINIQGAMAHVLGDLLGSVAAILAAGIILLTGWYMADPLLSMLVALLVAVAGLRIVRRAVRVLAEGAPPHLDRESIRRALCSQVAGLADVHHLHVWALAPERPIATLHARISEGGDQQAVLHAIHEQLARDFGIHHATVQIETDLCTDEVR